MADRGDIDTPTGAKMISFTDDNNSDVIINERHITLVRWLKDDDDLTLGQALISLSDRENEIGVQKGDESHQVWSLLMEMVNKTQAID